MPRVTFVKKARKDNPVCKRGGSYYWWKFNYGRKQYSLTRPKRSQLTRSSFLSGLWALEDDIPDEIDEDGANSIIADLENLLDDCQCSLDNMPEQLQDTSSAGEMLQDRIYGLEAWMDEIRDIDWENIAPDEAADIVRDTNPGID